MAVPYSFDPTDWHVWFDDFDKYTAGDWTLTTVEAGAGSATEAISNADGGVLLITNDAADDDSDFFQWAKETFKFVSGKRLYFAIRFQTNDATQSDIVAGLQITDTTPLAVSDGIYFRKDDGDTNIDFVCIKNSDSTGTALTAVGTLADATWTKLAFYYDGAGSDIDVLINDVVVGAVPLTNVPDDEELTISFGIQNGAAAAKTMSVDYVLVCRER